eukprot:7385340-Prymnesium_polylepis.1
MEAPPPLAADLMAPRGRPPVGHGSKYVQDPTTLFFQERKLRSPHSSCPDMWLDADAGDAQPTERSAGCGPSAAGAVLLAQSPMHGQSSPVVLSRDTEGKRACFSQNKGAP